jgi:hypothetical protein
MSKNFKIKNLLASTWSERLKAEQALLAEVLEELEDTNVLSEELKKEIDDLIPSPKVFLSALVAFWADVSEKTFNERMKGFNHKSESYSAEKWSSPHLVKYTMTPKQVPEAGMLMPGMWVWNFISKIGNYCNMIEPQLIACLNHPEPVVTDAVERSFGGIVTISDDSFEGFLKFADKRGRNGEIIAKHVNKDRLDIVLKNLEPNNDERLTTSRFNIIQFLEVDLAKDACNYLLIRLMQNWSDKQLADLIYTLSKQLLVIDFKQEELKYIENLAQHEDGNIRSSVAGFLAKLDPNKYIQTLTNLSHDSHAWVLMSLCVGLTQQSNLPGELVKTLLKRSLNNFDGYDGEPHVSAVQLLIGMGSESNVYIDIIQKYWEEMVIGGCLDYGEVTHILDIVDNLGNSAVVFLESLEQALVSLADDEDEEDEYPSLDEPNAVPEIKQKMREQMLESGATEKEATEVAEFNGMLLDVFADNLDDIQAGIDEVEVEYDKQMRENFGDDWDVDEEELEVDSEEEYEYEDDDEIIRLRAKISELNKIKASL